MKDSDNQSREFSRRQFVGAAAGALAGAAILGQGVRAPQALAATDPRGTMFTRTDLLAGAQIGAWDMDGGTSVNNATAVANLKAVPVKLIRWQMWHKPADLGGTQTTAQFQQGINGIIAAGAIPLIGLPPIVNTQYSGTDMWSYAWMQWIIQKACPLGVVLFEMGNEPDNYGGLSAQQYYDTLWAPNVPALKAYARSLGYTIFVGGPAWANSYSSNEADIQTFLTATKNGYTSHGNNRDYVPDFISTHTYLTETENSSQSAAQSRITSWASFYDTIQSQINTTYAGLNDTNGYPLASEIKLCDSEYNDTINNGSTINNSQTWTDFYMGAMVSMFAPSGPGTRLWAAVEFTIASEDGALDMLNSDGTAKPEYNSFKAKFQALYAGGTSTGQSNTLEGGTNGTTVTPANSGGASGNAFNTVSGSVKYTSTTPPKGLLAAVLTYTAGVQAWNYFGWDSSEGVHGQEWFRFRLRIPSAYPTTALRLYQATNFPVTALNAALLLNTNGTLSFVDANNGVLFTTTTAVPLNQAVRLEGFVKASPTNGETQLKLYLNQDATTSSELKTSILTANTGSSMGAHYFGDFAGSTQTAGRTLILDDPAISHTGYIGP